MTRLLATLAVVLGLAGIARAQNVSPGPLARDHAALEGVDNCIRCHAGRDAVSAPACLSCHKALGQQIAARAGFHATTGSDCASCHPDHRGVNAALVKWPRGQDAFDHDKAGYKLVDAHAKVKCRDCHKVAFLTGGVATALTAEERPRTFLGLSPACASCHADIHKPTLGRDCERCHTVKTWRDATTSTGFDHGKTKYALLGAHAKVACTKCHGGTTQKLAELHPKFDACRTCHADPHAGAMGTATKVCESCHRESSWKDSRYDRSTHAPKTLPLVNGHAKPTCAACHGEKVDKLPGTACGPSCHADVHKPSLGIRCETCHSTITWMKPTTRKVDFHDRTAYPLRGVHVAVACDACHDPKKPAATRFRPLAFKKCLDCHADPHKGETPSPCETCHVVESKWRPARFELADHAKTRYPLEGAHRAVPCAACHPAPPKSPGFNLGNPACEKCHADPHTGQFAGKGACASCHGVVAWSPSTYTKDAHAKVGFPLTGKHDIACGKCHAKQFVDVPTECSACHADRHAGQLADRKCTACHAGAAWKPTVGFDHDKSFALRGKHAKADCARCHPAREIQAPPGKPFPSAVYRLGKSSHECIGCHRAQHGDAKSGLDHPRRLAAATRACKECHDETSWRDVATTRAFDHDATGAPLVGGHARTACSACHTERRALPRILECAKCHADRHGGRIGERCERCHSPATWKQDQILVDHNRTRLPLAGAHAVQRCTACHVDAQAGTYRGLDPSCRSCHFHTVQDQRPHPDHTKDNAFNNCENCHSVLAWRPAHIDHDRYYPLTGKHQTTACAACHKAGDRFSAAPSMCLGCHAKDETTANGKVPGHDTYGPICGDCHTTSAWPTSAFDHPQYPTTHHNSTCANCHTTASMPQLYTCTGGVCHDTAQVPRPGVGHKGGDQSCARMGCHYGGSGGG